MNVGKLCGLAVIIVVIAPMLVGMVWPTDTEDKDVWTVESGTDLTPSLETRDIPVFDYYNGPMNNLTVIKTETVNGVQVPVIQLATPADPTSTENSYPVGTPSDTTGSSPITLASLRAIDTPRVDITGIATVSGFTGQYDFIQFYPKTNTLVLLGSDIETVSVGDATITPDSSVLVRTYTITGYMNNLEGLGAQGLGSGSWYWTNGFENRSVEMWATFTTPLPSYIEVGGLRLSESNGTVTAAYGGVTETIGSAYDYFRMRWDSSGEVTVSGLIGVVNFGDSTYEVGNTVTFAGTTGEQTNFQMKGSYCKWWVMSTESAIATAKGIENGSIVPDSYFPTHQWQIDLANPSTFGSSIGIGGLDFAVSDSRTITVTSIEDGETTEIPVRDMKILSLILDGQQTVYINGIPIIEQTPASMTIDLDGRWWLSVVMHRVTQDVKTEYVWEPGSFGLDQTGFCLVGLLSCIGIMIAGGLWGRKSGEKIIPLYITMAIAAAAFLMMM